MASGRRLLTAAVMLLSAAAAAGCVSMPSSGQPQPDRPSQGTGVSEQQYLQVSTVPPGTGWNPHQIVDGFLAANASFAENHLVAREYLTPAASKAWDQNWSAKVFNGGPVVRKVTMSGRTAIVTVGGPVQASVADEGAYGAPTSTKSSSTKPITIKLTKMGKEWRISKAPPDLLLSATDFQATYQQHDLYFFDPSLKYLVADPIYVPVAFARAADPENLLSGLVRDLINPPRDWVGNATTTTLPRGTSLAGAVNLAGGIATVNLNGVAIGRLHTDDDQLIAAQLVWTLVGSADSQSAVTGVELSINGKPWIPPNGNGNPVLVKAGYANYVPTGPPQKSPFYYLDSKGDVWRAAAPSGGAKEILREPAKGPHLSTIAVSPDGRYLAGLINGAIYTAPIGPTVGKLQSRDLSGYMSLSWDPNDNLWAAGPSGVVMLPSGGGAPVTVNDLATPSTITAVRVAPDGVRIALVVGGKTIQFAAIPKQTTGNQIIIFPQNLSPFSVSGSGISGVTWYGPDNVIALSGGTGPQSQAQAWEYPVNGGNSTPVLQQAGTTNITASWNNALIASTATGGLLYTETIGGEWVTLGFSGESAVYPG